MVGAVRQDGAFHCFFAAAKTGLVFRMSKNKKKKNGLPYETRRKLKTAAKKMVEQELVAQSRQIALAAVHEAVDRYTVAAAYIIHNELGFGKKRTQRLMGKIMTLFDDIEAGLLDFEDLKQVLEEECDLYLERGETDETKTDLD